MSIAENLKNTRQETSGYQCRIIAVSKTHPVEAIREAYNHEQKVFGENKVQELTEKQPELPGDIEWHMIGHLQRNKVKYIAPFIALIHAVDSMRLLKEINKEAAKNNRIISCLLQVHIAGEDSKYGLSYEQCRELLNDETLPTFENVRIRGLMGMATLTGDRDKIREEFRSLKAFFDEQKNKKQAGNVDMKHLSMGMSNDYDIALEEGSTFIRVGSKIFGKRNYDKT